MLTVRIYVLLMVAVLLHLSMSVPSVQGQPLVGNGRIAFQANWDGDWEIYSINPDGSDLQQLTFNTIPDEYPAWSPDGSQIAYISDYDNLYVMRADGTDQQLLLETTNARHPVWSPDGSKIAFQQESVRFSDIYILDLSSMSVTNVTNTPDELDGSPDWSPDGSQIAFASNGDNPVPPPIDGDPRMDIFTANLDGTNRSLISVFRSRIGNVNWTTENSIIFSIDGFELSSILSVPVTGGDINRISEAEISSTDPNLSPDHQTIVFVRENQIATMNPDGTGLVVLTNWTSRIAHPSWQPIIVTNQPPTADAGPDQTLTDSNDDGSELVTLDGSGSSEADGTIESYVWTEDDVEIATGVNPQVSLSVGVHTVTLTVTDDDGATDTDEVVITVSR